MATTPSTKTATTTTAQAIKTFATAAAIMGALGLGALGAAGAAAAAPGAHHAPSTTSGSSENAGPAVGHADAEVHAHFIPGFKPAPPPASGVPAAAVPGDLAPDLIIPPSPRADLPHPGWTPIPSICGSAGCSDIVDQ
jgi:hypothetical protein